MGKPTTIIIIDDHRIVRRGLKELLENLGNYKVIDEFENGLAFTAKLPELKTIPDVFLLDYSMPMMDGIQVLKQATSISDNYKFLLLTQNLDETIIDEAYVNGARGFLKKTCTGEELKATIDDIATKGYCNFTEILKRVRSYTQPVENPKAYEALTKKELRFLELVCNENEYTYSEIASLMKVSVKSIDKYRANLFEKLDIKSKVGLVLFSFKHKVTKPFL